MKRLATAVLLGLAVHVSWAQLIEQAAPADLVDKLAPPAPSTRSLRNLVPRPAPVDLSIQFDFDSAQLQAPSLPLLDNLAAALNNERLAPLKFQVEGHTDAKGRADYNLQLSARRAAAVRQYLISQGVSAERLQAVGKGSSELLLAARPLAAENRRVRVMLMP